MVGLVLREYGEGGVSVSEGELSLVKKQDERLVRDAALKVESLLSESEMKGFSA